jgi:hypothetical protein
MARILQSPRFAIARRAGVLASVGLFAIAGAGACASAGPYNPSQLPLTQLSQVQELCGSVMGIPAGIRLSSDCVENLSGAAVAISQAQTLQEARRNCLAKGLAPGRPGLAECEVASVSQHADPASDGGAVRVDTSGLQRPAKSYFDASFDELHKREQTACARLGYDPINSSFSRCVARLDSALFASAHPMQ